MFVIVVCTSFASTAQSPFYHFFEDTIKPGYRISKTLDSTDAFCSPYASTTVQFFQPSLRTFNFSQFNSLPSISIPRRYSSIPHIGFAYSMGSNTQQLGKISYTQALDSNDFIQMDYLRQSTNGAMRNQDLKRNQMEFSWLHRGDFYGSSLDIKMLSLEQGLNGGLLGDTIQNDFGLDFQDVNKSNARQKYNVVNARMENFLSFTANESLKTGFFLNPFVNVANRRYTEADTLLQIYGSTNYDTLVTQDFWQRGEIGASAGYFFHTKPFVINGGIEAKYWDFDNFLVHSDTVEVAAVGDLIVDLKSGWNWKNNARINVIGALGEFSATSTLRKQFSFLDIKINVAAGRRYPQNYQRSYYGNTVAYSWNTKTQETYLRANANANLKVKGQVIQLFGGVDQRFNMPLFFNNQWRQDTLTTLSFAYVGGGIDFQWRKLLLQPKVTFQLASINVIPSLIFQTRLAYNGTIFKAKKLRNVTGVDFGYSTGYSLMAYTPMMDVYSFTNAGNTFFAMPKLHFFSQFDLGYFRWFVRIENIEQLFQSETNMEAIGYPVLPTQLRFGVSWDLFN